MHALLSTTLPWRQTSHCSMRTTTVGKHRAIHAKTVQSCHRSRCHMTSTSRAGSNAMHSSAHSSVSESRLATVHHRHYRTESSLCRPALSSLRMASWAEAVRSAASADRRSSAVFSSAARASRRMFLPMDSST
uniref:Uncharacterized protein n=1 Tax=Rhipicephalus zambeziensis TaxID=60191 RepID=A0A224YFD0_9ACAR